MSGQERPRPAVLCGVDDSDGSRDAVRPAAGLGSALGIRVVVVHVARLASASIPRTRIGAGVVADAMEQLEAIALEAGEKLLDRQIRDAGVHDCERRVVIGKPAEQLLMCAEAEDAAMIVVGSRGRAVLAGAALGSVSADVLAAATGPVVVVPPGTDDTAEEARA